MLTRPARAILGRRAAAAPPAPGAPPAAGAAQQPCDGLLRPDAVAGRLGVATATLATWRGTGAGPAFVRLSHKTVRYQPAEVEKFIAERVRASTAAERAPTGV
jgi:predicted DNA-binding transcriptional regulator AlpA